MNRPQSLFFEVGKPYEREAKEYPEGMAYRFQTAYHRIFLFIREPNQIAMEAFKRGQMRFALYVEGEALFMLFMCNHPGIFDEPGIAWRSAAYSWQLGAKNELPWPAEMTPEGQGAMASVILIDAATGIVRAIMAINFSHAFTKVLHNAIHAQAFESTLKEDALHRLFQSIQERYPTAAALAKAAQSKCLGGIDESGK